MNNTQRRSSSMQDPLLYYEVHGTHGPFILLVHGIMSSRAQWIPNLESLTAFCRPVIVELLGHGRSPSPEESERYTPDSYVGEFERIRLKLGVERWFVCGQSLGASLTLRYALYHPEHIISQVFTNSRSALSENPPVETMQMLGKRLEEEGSKLLNDFPLHPSKSSHIKPEIKEALIEDVKLINIHGFSYTMRYMVTQCSVRDIIQENRIPTLLIVGKYDKRFASLPEFAKANIPKLEILLLDGGHAVNIDASEEFNKGIKDFVLRSIQCVG